MLKSVKVSLKDSLIYGFGNIAVKVIGFVLIPLYTDPKYFSVDDFGIIALLDISGLILISMMASGLPQSLTRWYWDKDYRDKQKGIFFMSFTFQVIVSLLFCIFLFPFTRQFSGMLLKTTDWAFVIRLLILSSALQAINNLINSLMRVQSNSILYTAVNLTKLIMVLVLTVWFIVFKGKGIAGIYLAQVIGNIVFIIILAGYIFKNSRAFFDFHLFLSMSRFGYPFLLANFAAALLAVVDRYSLNSLALLNSVAIYSLAYKISSVLKLVIVDSIKTAVLPMAMQKMDDPDNRRFYSKTMLYSSYVLMLGIIGVSLFSYEVIKVISGSKAFWSAFIVVPVLSLAVFFTNMRETSSYGLIIKKKTRVVGVNIVIAVILNIALNLLLIPEWDVIGAACATLISQFVYWILNYYFSQKEYFIPYEIRKIALMFICGAALSFTGLLLKDLSIVPRLLIKSACVVSFPFILYIFNFYEPVELKSIRGFITKWSRPGKLKENLRSLKNITEKP